MDLRAEPVVLCVPEIERNRYYSVMITSQYTCNFVQLGSRASGNGAGCSAVAVPAWKGATPKGIKKVFVPETESALAPYRAQLFDPADIDHGNFGQASRRLDVCPFDDLGPGWR